MTKSRIMELAKWIDYEESDEFIDGALAKYAQLYPVIEALVKQKADLKAALAQVAYPASGYGLRHAIEALAEDAKAEADLLEGLK